jgi:hypothetical protein
MKNQIAIALPSDWCTVARAGEILGLSQRQVRRYIRDGVLAGGTPQVGAREQARQKTMVRVDEVMELRTARAKLAPAPVDNCDAATDRGRPWVPEEYRNAAAPGACGKRYSEAPEFMCGQAFGHNGPHEYDRA